MSNQTNRSRAVVRVLNNFGIPLQRGYGTQYRWFTGLPGWEVLFGGRNGLNIADGDLMFGKGTRVGPRVALRHLARTSGRKPLTIQCYEGDPFDEAIVSLYLRDWAELMLRAIEEDPHRYHITTRKD